MNVSQLHRVALAAVVLVLVGCAAGDEAVPEAPRPTPEMTVQLQARAFARACLLAICAGAPILAPDDTQPEVRDAIRELFSDEVEYLDQTALEELTGDGGRFVNGATLIDIGPYHGTERPDVIGIDVSTSRGSFDVVILTFLFRWDGVEWVDAESEDTGVTVTSAVS